MGLRDFTLYDVVERNARLAAEQTAFVFEGRRVTHAGHLARVDRLAAGLAAAGIAAGDRIVILSFNNLEFVELYGAAARLGAMLVPINWRLSDDEIAYVASDAEPKMVIADAAHQDKLAARKGDLGSVRHWHGIGGATAPFVPFASLYAEDTVRERPDVAADAPFVMFHTAAVSGRPRGAVLSQAGLIAGNLQLARYWSLAGGDVNLGVLPLFHLAGLIMLLATQHAGGATVLLQRFEPEAAARLIREEKVTLLAEFPPILANLLDTPAGARDLASLRAVTGLDAPDTIARFETLCPQARFWAAFGQSETSGFVTMAPFRDRPGSAGRPTYLSMVAVVDDHDRTLPTGETGEIVVRGPGVFKGYWRCDADTEFTFRNGWHHTGDMGAFDADGYLWYKGRSPAKELIKPGGENVYPAEVEGAIAAHPAVADVVVIGVPDPQWGEAIKAVCVLRPGQSATAPEIIDFVAGRIARFKRPKHVVFVDALPKTPAGAIDRNKVKEAHAHA
jgi:acyl-CoA synthetase (AMP-forming)/AMP-acid ligase II